MSAEDHVRRFSGNNLHGKYTNLRGRPPLLNWIYCPNSNNFICYSFLTLQSKLVSSGMKLKAKVRHVSHSGHWLLICSIIHYILSGPWGVSWTVSEDFRSEDGSIEHYRCKENISSTEECQVDYFT